MATGKSKDSAASAEQRGENSPTELAERAANPQSTTPDEEIEKHLRELSPEQAEIFVRSLEVILRRRRVRLFGYIAALIVFMSTMAISVYLYGTRDPGTFMGWIVLVPFALIALVFLVVGRLEKRIAPVLPPSPGTSRRQSGAGEEPDGDSEKSPDPPSGS